MFHDLVIIGVEVSKRDPRAAPTKKYGNGVKTCLKNLAQVTGSVTACPWHPALQVVTTNLSQW
jgi:hypothetical protein